jgi:hypothetical protein
VNEYVLSAVLGRDEAEALVVIEEFYDTCWHERLLSVRFGEIAKRTLSRSSFSINRQDEFPAETTPLAMRDHQERN